MGARSEHWPVSDHIVQSYVKEALKEKVTEDPVVVRVLNAERTFWEKATILHQYAHLPEDKKLPPRISRHLYDFFCLLNSPVKPKALSDLSLLERILEALETDFGLMKSMFFGGDIPEWKLILKVIEEFEREFNGSSSEKR